MVSEVYRECGDGEMKAREMEMVSLCKDGDVKVMELM